ncbi:hypothetical protein J6590_035989 [Homalodisca vitripennis]|nr:hypothetical protein J6590_035989 [Homalodisca vitripennis]
MASFRGGLQYKRVSSCLWGGREPAGLPKQTVNTLTSFGCKNYDNNEAGYRADTKERDEISKEVNKLFLHLPHKPPHHTSLPSHISWVEL